MTTSPRRLAALGFVVALASYALAAYAQAPTPAPLPAESINCVELSTALRAVNTNDARLRDWPQIARYHDANISFD